MPPDHDSSRLPEGARPEFFDRTIPRRMAVKTRISGVFEVNMQVGPFIAMPVMGIVLWFGLDTLAGGMAAAALLVAAARRSHLSYRRIRTE
ncbi:hypothetical protein [Streptomyces sp. NPDC058745]|uniref:hypothetical protein n=1 Tax=Streptomyces sp. NPDC058745 TaxID=3346621 RepID=UPI00369A1701